MNLVDFIYRNESLSDHGLMVAYIDKKPSDTISAGSELTFDTVTNNATHRILSLNPKYETPISASFDIVKSDSKRNHCKEFSDMELSWIMRWLNCKTDEIFIPVYADCDFPNIYYRGKFTSLSYYVFGGKVIGITVTFKSDSPFGYTNREYKAIVTSGNETFTVFNKSDEFGYLYPSYVEIKCNCPSDSRLKIYHDESPSFDNSAFIVDHCENGETIILDCINKIIQTSRESHTTLFNDFNYNWIALFNTWERSQNIFRVSIPCEINMKYELIRKAGIIV